MGIFMKSRRKIIVELNQDMSLFLTQERSRLYTQYGLRVTPSDILKTLLYQHKMRIIQAVEEDESLLWYHDKLKERERDRTTEAAFAAENSTGRRLGKRKITGI
jgi:hypothetical protein